MITVGGASAWALADGARAAGLPARSIHALPTSEKAAERLLEIVQDGDLVLVKGSRGIRMDRVVERLKAGSA